MKKMAISDWVALGVAGVLLKKGLERAAEEREQNVQEYRQYEEERRQDEAESVRQKDVDIKRKNTPCGFKDGIVYQEFTAIAHKVGKRIKRIKKVTVSGQCHLDKILKQ